MNQPTSSADEQTSSPDNQQLVQAALAGDLAAAERTLRKLLSVDRWEESQIDETLRNTTDPKLWSLLLEVLTQRTWYGQPVPVASSAIPSGRSLDLKLRSLFLDTGGAGAQARVSALLQALKSDVAAEWQTAALLLGERGDNRATKALLRALHVGDHKLQARVAQVLSNLEDDRIVHSLIDLLATGDDVAHWEAAKSLVDVGPRAVPELCETLQSTTDDHLRWHITRALGEIGDPLAIPALVDLLGDENSGVRWRSANALAAIGPRAIPPLLSKLSSEKLTPWLRNSALVVLRSMGTGETATRLQPLVQALESREASLQCPVVAHQILDEMKREGQMHERSG